MQIMAAQLGAPFNSEKEARKTWSQMDKNQTGRVKEEEFVEWWYNKEQDVLRKKLSEQLGFSTEKLGKGRGVVFGWEYLFCYMYVMSAVMAINRKLSYIF